MPIEKLLGTFEGKSDSPVNRSTVNYDDIACKANVKVTFDGPLGKGYGVWTQMAAASGNGRSKPINYLGMLSFPDRSGKGVDHKFVGMGTCEPSGPACWKYRSVFVLNERTLAVEHWWNYTTQKLHGIIYEWNLDDRWPGEKGDVVTLGRWPASSPLTAEKVPG
jgi:hypothetical protein